MTNRRSDLGLDENNTFLEKLGLFFSDLFLGPLIGVFLFLGIFAAHEPWRTIGFVCFDTLVVFWVMVLIFIWWRPRWLRALYLRAERDVIWIVNGTLLVGLLASVLGMLALAIGWAVGFVARWS